MKKLLSLTLTLVMMLSILIIPTTAGAETLTSGDYSYEVKVDGTVTITKYNGSEEVFTIPSILDGITVTEIGANAFAGNDSVVYVKIPDTVKKLGVNVFMNCHNLKDIVIGKNVTYIPANAFTGCSSMTSYTVPSHVTDVGVDALPYTLKSLTIGKSVNSIFDTRNSLGRYSSLAEIKVSDSNESYKSVKGVLYNKAGTTLVLYPQAKTDKSYTLSTAVTKIEKSAFENNKYLEKITFNKNLKTIESRAFYNCKKLKKVVILKNVTKINNSAFYDCKSVNSLTIDANKNLQIGKAVFNNLTNLKKLTAPTVAVSEMFNGCTKLNTLTIPKKVKTIAEKEFLNCPKLKTVTIPKTVKTIGKKAFGYTYDDYIGVFDKVQGFTVKGAKGSAAQKYAKANGFKFVAI